MIETGDLSAVSTSRIVRRALSQCDRAVEFSSFPEQTHHHPKERRRDGVERSCVVAKALLIAAYR
jgi:hypothetical protein